MSIPRLPARSRPVAIALAALASLVIGTPAAAHAQLVSSTPGAGEVVAESPTSLQLVFSEPLDPAFAGVDLFDQDEVAVATGIGEPDASDPHVLVAEISPLPDGLYTVHWHALSAADGHVTEGFFTFGVGDVEVIEPGGMDHVGGLHLGQTAITAAADVISRAAGYAGSMLAFGLLIIGFAVARPSLGRWPREIGLVGAIALALAAAGAAGGLLVGASGLAGVTGVGPVQYLTDTRTGLLLGARFVVAAGGAVAAIALVRRDAGRAIGVAGAAGGIGLVLIALGSHADATGAIGPVVADVVHLAAAGTWMSGLAFLVLLGFLGAVPPDVLRAAVPRFSALALVSVGLVVASGVYAGWLHVADLAGLDSDYGRVLIAKVAVAGAAMTIGAINYFDAGRNWRIGGGLRRRVMGEVVLASVVVVLAANLAGGSPPGGLRIVDVPATSGSEGVSLAFQGGQPGPNRAFATLAPPAVHDGTVVLELQRMDSGSGTSAITLTPDHTDPDGLRFTADGILLPEGSRWDATVVAHDHTDAEVARARFSFAMAATGLSVDRGFNITLGLLVIAGLLVGGIGGLGYWIGGGGLPGTDPILGRTALVVGSVIGLVLGALLLVGGPPG